jgi:hypothetical protein
VGRIVLVLHAVFDDEVVESDDSRVLLSADILVSGHHDVGTRVAAHSVTAVALQGGTQSTSRPIEQRDFADRDHTLRNWCFELFSRVRGQRLHHAHD